MVHMLCVWHDVQIGMVMRGHPVTTHCSSKFNEGKIKPPSPSAMSGAGFGAHLELKMLRDLFSIAPIVKFVKRNKQTHVRRFI